MKVLIVDNKSYGMIPITQEMESMGWKYHMITSDIQGKRKMPVLEEQLHKILEQESYDFVFSFNYYVAIAEFCYRKGIRYVSWVYDSPLVSLYSYTMVYNTNYVFLFDYAQYKELSEIGLDNVFYLPLASNTLQCAQNLDWANRNYLMDISFVGSLYNEEKNDLFAKFDRARPYVKGYLDALVDIQQKLYGVYILREGLNEGVMEELQRICPYEEIDNREGVESAAYIYADYFIARRVTSKERLDVLKRLSNRYSVDIFSGSACEQLPGICQHGKIDYYLQMPGVFQTTKINLNITLKSIRTGIPLRMLDIMGAGGFLLTNYQMEMDEYFVAGSHYDYYGSMEELEEKAGFYLHREELREKIAYKGYCAIRENFNYHTQLEKIKQIIKR